MHRLRGDLAVAAIADAQEASAGSATIVAAMQDAHALDGLRIMVIDDEEEEARDALYVARTASGGQIVLAASGDEALGWLGAHQHISGHMRWCVTSC